MCREFCGGLELSACIKQLKLDRALAAEELRRQRSLMRPTEVGYLDVTKPEPEEPKLAGRWVRRGRKLAFASAVVTGIVATQSALPAAAYDFAGADDSGGGGGSDAGSGSDGGNDSGVGTDSDGGGSGTGSADSPDGDGGDAAGDAAGSGGSDAGGESDGGNDSGVGTDSDGGSGTGAADSPDGDGGDASGDLGGGADDAGSSGTGAADSPDGDGGDASGDLGGGADDASSSNGSGGSNDSGAGVGEPDGLDVYDDDLSEFGTSAAPTGPTPGSPGAEAGAGAASTSTEAEAADVDASTNTPAGEGPSAGSPGAEASNDGHYSGPATGGPDGLDDYNEDMSDLGSADLSGPTPGSPGAEASDDGAFSSPESTPESFDLDEAHQENVQDMAAQGSGASLTTVNETLGPTTNLSSGANAPVSVGVNDTTLESDGTRTSSYPSEDGQTVQAQNTQATAEMSGASVTVNPPGPASVTVAGGQVVDSTMEADRVTTPVGALGPNGEVPSAEDPSNLPEGATATSFDLEQTEDGVYGSLTVEAEAETPEAPVQGSASLGVEVAADVTPLEGTISSTTNTPGPNTSVTTGEVQGDHVETSIGAQGALGGSASTPGVDGMPAVDTSASGSGAISVVNENFSGTSSTVTTEIADEDDAAIQDQHENGNIHAAEGSMVAETTTDYSINSTVVEGTLSVTTDTTATAPTGETISNTNTNTSEVSFEVDRETESHSESDLSITPGGANGESTEAPADREPVGTSESTTVTDDNDFAITSSNATLDGIPDSQGPTDGQNSVSANNGSVQGTDAEMSDLAQDTIDNNSDSEDNGFLNDVATGSTVADAAIDNPNATVTEGAEAMVAQEAENNAPSTDQPEGMGDTSPAPAPDDSDLSEPEDNNDAGDCVCEIDYTSPVDEETPEPSDNEGSEQSDQVDFEPQVTIDEVSVESTGLDAEAENAGPVFSGPEDEDDAPSIPDPESDTESDPTSVPPTPQQDDQEPGGGDEQDPPPTVRPDCESADSDPDGDGFGWENEQTCLVVAPVEEPAQAATDDAGTPDYWATDSGTEQVAVWDEPADSVNADDSRPTCSSADLDPDGDGFGWENEQTCLV